MAAKDIYIQLIGGPDRVLALVPLGARPTNRVHGVRLRHVHDPIGIGLPPDRWESLLLARLYVLDSKHGDKGDKRIRRAVWQAIRLRQSIVDAVNRKVAEVLPDDIVNAGLILYHGSTHVCRIRVQCGTKATMLDLAKRYRSLRLLGMERLYSSANDAASKKKVEKRPAAPMVKVLPDHRKEAAKLLLEIDEQASRAADTKPTRRIRVKRTGNHGFGISVRNPRPVLEDGGASDEAKDLREGKLRRPLMDYGPPALKPRSVFHQLHLQYEQERSSRVTAAATAKPESTVIRRTARPGYWEQVASRKRKAAAEAGARELKRAKTEDAGETEEVAQPIPLIPAESSYVQVANTKSRAISYQFTSRAVTQLVVEESKIKAEAAGKTKGIEGPTQLFPTESWFIQQAEPESFAPSWQVVPRAVTKVIAEERRIKDDAMGKAETKQPKKFFPAEWLDLQRSKVIAQTRRVDQGTGTYVLRDGMLDTPLIALLDQGRRVPRETYKSMWEKGEEGPAVSLLSEEIARLGICWGV
ncbi:hypothetical protein LTR37_015900 [Vermiconidia calcicola]|uniref:Uncharacterized protein n=1 Tax=Vermiconidia calcicola TaxID=1690605 RepID=A0ACC3MQB5_9PEZI|nr:hypothetical protein LTR37_015900 [Vermiconidia calcicola]